jgi:hypothetical protein
MLAASRAVSSQSSAAIAPSKVMKELWSAKAGSQITASWVFEHSPDGTILFYPHGWGRAYVVPTEEKRREIEEFLTLWMERLRQADRVFRLGVPAAVIFLLAMLTPPFRRYVPFWPTLFRRTEHLFLACVLVWISSPFLLRFLAETAKTDLEKSDMRRPYAQSLSHRSWHHLWLEQTISGFALLLGLWLLWPRRYSVVLPARTIPALLAPGLAFATIGGVLTVTNLWQMTTKLRLERRLSNRR